MSETSPRMGWAYPSADADPWNAEFDDFVAAMDASGFASREDRSIIFAGGGTIAWALGSSTLSWSGTMYVLSPITGRLIQVASGSKTLSEGEVLYLALTRQALTTVSVALQKASQVPSNDQDIILCFRRDDRVYFRTGFSLGNGDTADGLAPTPGSSGGSPLVVEDEGIGVEADTRLMDFVGDGVTVSSTGPNDVQITIPGLEVQKDGGSIETAVDTIDFRGPVTAVNVAPEEVRITVNGLNVFDEGGAIEPDVTSMDFVGPGVVAAKTGAGAVSVTVSGAGTDPNAIHDNVAAEISAIAPKAIPTVSDFLIIEDAAGGDAKKRITIGNLPIGATDIKTARIVVGNAPNGDAAADCDFLDAGDGVALQAALAASSIVSDIYVKPGTYDLGAGAAVSPLAVPANVKARGAGRRHTRIRTDIAGDQGAFTLLGDSMLEDIGIEVALPVAPGIGSTGVVALQGDRAQCRRVGIDFLGPWSPVEAAFTALRACFEVNLIGVATYQDCQLVDCIAGASAAVPSLIDLGLAPGNEMVVFSVHTGASGNPVVSAMVKRCRSDGGDWAGRALRPVRVLDSTFTSMMSRGWLVSGAPAEGSEIGDCHIVSNFGGIGTERGIVLDTVMSVGIVDNFIYCDTPVPGQQAIELLGSDWNTIRGNRGPGGLLGAVRLDSTSDDNVVVGQNFRGAAYTDLGARNEKAHNK